MKNFYSPNFNKKKRLINSIKLIIIHYTGMQSERESLKRLCNPLSKVSAHYLINQKGKIFKLVEDRHIAWHAGKSSWKKFNSLNKFSIGIELNNSGHDNKYENFKFSQIYSLKELLKNLIKKYHIKNEDVLGHSDIAPDRKKDPGEKFPWKELAKNNLCLWHNLNENKVKKLRNQKINPAEQSKFIKNLQKIGYNKIKSNNSYIIKAFQRKFRQKLVNGKIDKECLLISQSLLK